MRKLILTPKANKSLLLTPKPSLRVKLPLGVNKRNVAMKKMSEMEMFTEKRKNTMKQMKHKLRSKVLT